MTGVQTCALPISRHGGEAGLYPNELRRALIWAGVLPLGAIALAVLVSPSAILIWPALIAVQFMRLAIRDSALASVLSIIGKYAELVGIVRFAGRRLRGETGDTVTYK